MELGDVVAGAPGFAPTSLRDGTRGSRYRAVSSTPFAVTAAQSCCHRRTSSAASGSGSAPVATDRRVSEEPDDGMHDRGRRDAMASRRRAGSRWSGPEGDRGTEVRAVDGERGGQLDDREPQVSSEMSGAASFVAPRWAGRRAAPAGPVRRRTARRSRGASRRRERSSKAGSALRRPHRSVPASGDARRLDEQAVHGVQERVPAVAGHRPRGRGVPRARVRIFSTTMCGLGPGRIAHPRQVSVRVGQTVDVIDAQAYRDPVPRGPGRSAAGRGVRRLEDRPTSCRTATNEGMSKNRR